MKNPSAIIPYDICLIAILGLSISSVNFLFFIGQMRCRLPFGRIRMIYMSACRLAWYSLVAIIAIMLISCKQNQLREKPNVLLIVSDDLGFSDLDSYGSEIETPHSDQLAKDGVRMTHFYTTGRSFPPRASLLTRQYPHKVGLGHMTKDLGQPGYQGSIDKTAITLGEILKNSGYRTFMSGKWHLGTQDPTQHGFEEYYGTLVSAKTFWDTDHFIHIPNEQQKGQVFEGYFYGTEGQERVL